MWESGLGLGETYSDTPSDPQTGDPRAGLETLGHSKRCKPVYSKSSIWNCQPEPHATDGVLTVPLKGSRYSSRLARVHAVALWTVTQCVAGNRGRLIQ